MEGIKPIIAPPVTGQASVAKQSRRILSAVLVVTFTATSIPCLEAASIRDCFAQPATAYGGVPPEAVTAGLAMTQLAPASRFSKETAPALQRKNPIFWAALAFAGLNVAAYLFGTTEDFVGVLGVTGLCLTVAARHRVTQWLAEKRQDPVFDPYLYTQVFLGGNSSEAEQVLLGVIKSRFGEDESDQLKDAASREILAGMRERGSLEVPGVFAKGEILAALKQSTEAEEVVRRISRKDREKAEEKQTREREGSLKGKIRVVEDRIGGFRTVHGVKGNEVSESDIQGLLIEAGFSGKDDLREREWQYIFGLVDKHNEARYTAYDNAKYHFNRPKGEHEWAIDETDLAAVAQEGVLRSIAKTLKKSIYLNKSFFGFFVRFPYHLFHQFYFQFFIPHIIYKLFKSKEDFLGKEARLRVIKAGLMEVKAHRGGKSSVKYKFKTSAVGGAIHDFFDLPFINIIPGHVTFFLKRVKLAIASSIGHGILALLPLSILKFGTIITLGTFPIIGTVALPLTVVSIGSAFILAFSLGFFDTLKRAKGESYVQAARRILTDTRYWAGIAKATFGIWIVGTEIQAMLNYTSFLDEKVFGHEDAALHKAANFIERDAISWGSRALLSLEAATGLSLSNAIYHGLGGDAPTAEAKLYLAEEAVKQGLSPQGTVPVSNGSLGTVPLFNGGEIGKIIGEVGSIDSAQFAQGPEVTDAERENHERIKREIVELQRRMSEIARSRETLEQRVALSQDVADLSERLSSQADRLEALPATTLQIERQRQSLPDRWNAVSSGGGASIIQPSNIPHSGKGEGTPSVDVQSILDDIGSGQVTHGGGNLPIGDWIADVEGGNGYLANATYSKIDPLAGDRLLIKANFQDWQLDAGALPSGWVTIPTHGRDEMILPLPPQKKIVTIQTENPSVRGAVYYDFANKIWAAKFDSSPGGFIRIGIEDAASNELGDISQVEIAETVPESWRENLPHSVRQALEEAKALSLEERKEVKKKILKSFYYTTNPYMEELNARCGNFLETAFTYYALKCDGFAVLDAILSHELGISVVIQRGFMDSEKSGTFTSGERHSWVLTEDGIEEATSFAGQVSPLYNKMADSRAWRQELEYIKARAGHATEQLELAPEMARLGKEEERLKQGMASLERDLAQNDAGAGRITVSQLEGYYDALLKEYDKKLDSLNIPALALRGKEAMLPIYDMLEGCLRATDDMETGDVTAPVIRAGEEDCKLMAKGHFLFKVLAQIEEILPKLKPPLTQEGFDGFKERASLIKNTVFYRMGSSVEGSRAEGRERKGWDSLREPFPKDAQLLPKGFEDLVIIPPTVPFADETVRDLIIGKEYKIPHGAELVDFSQGLLVIRIPRPGGEGVYKIIGEKAKGYEEREFSGIPKILTSFNGDWLAVARNVTKEKIGGRLGIMRIDEFLIGPLVEEAEMNELNNEVSTVESVALRADGKWVAKVTYHGGSEGYVGTLAQEAGLHGKRFEEILGDPVIIFDESFVGWARDGDGTWEGFVGGAYAEALNEKVQEAVGDKELRDCKVLPNGEWIALVEDSSGRRSFVGPLAEKWNLAGRGFEWQDSQEPFTSIERIFPEGLIYVRAGILKYVLGPLDEDATERTLFAEISAPVFSSDGKWAAIVEYPCSEEEGAGTPLKGLIGTWVPSNISATRYHEIRNAYGLEGFGSGEKGDYGIYVRRGNEWSLIEFLPGETGHGYPIDFEPPSLDPQGPEYIQQAREEGISYKRRIQGLYNIVLDSEEDYLPDRPDVMWRHFDTLVEKGEDNEALTMLMRLIFRFEEFEVLDPATKGIPRVSGSQEIIRNTKEYLAAYETSTRENSAPRFYDHQEAMRILEKNLNWCIRNLHETMELPVLFTFLQRTGSGHLIVEAINERWPGGPANRNDGKVANALRECNFTPQESYTIVKDYIKWLRAKHEIPDNYEPYLYSSYFNSSFEYQIGGVNGLLLDELGGRYLQYAKELNKASSMIAMPGLPIYRYEPRKELNYENVKGAFALLRDECGMKDRLFDVEIAPSDRGHTAYKLVKLLRKNWVGFKFEDQEDLLKWKRVNQKLTEILGKDFAGEVKLPSAWQLLGRELIRDAFGVAFLIGALYFGLSYVSDGLRRKDKIIGLSAEEVISRILKENPWLRKERASLPRQSLTEKEQVIADCISAVALEPPSKSKSAPARLLSLIPFASLFLVRDTREHRARQAMNRGILELATKHSLSPREVRERLSDILNRYGEEKEIELPQGETKRSKTLTPDEVEAKIREAIKGVPLLRISPISAHSLKPNGVSLRRAGQGVEFFELREYQAGDDVGAINWKASARTDKHIIRVTETDVTKSASILIDIGAALHLTESETWLQELARSLTVVLDRRRLYDKGHYTLNKLIFIMPNGELEIEGHVNLRRGGVNAVMPILRQKYIRAKEMLGALERDKTTEYHLDFYTAEENARYAQRTRGILQHETETAKRLDQRIPRLNLSGEVVFCVGIQEPKREGISSTLSKNRTTPLFWHANQAQQILRRNP